MKYLLSVAVLFAAATWASPIGPRDENCEMEWVTVYADSNPQHPAAPESAASSGTQPRSDSSSSGLGTAGSDPIGSDVCGNGGCKSLEEYCTAIKRNGKTDAKCDDTTGPTDNTGQGTKGVVTTNPQGDVGIPLDGPHLSAPTFDADVPGDAIKFPSPGKTISGKALSTFIGDHVKENPPASKWIVIPEGTYEIDCNDNIVFSFMDGLNDGWTIDMRHVTFWVKGTCQAIYINQCENMKIYGGTLWFDSGEIWTQSKITTIDDIGDGHAKVTSVVEDGYNLTTWRDAGPRNLNVMDTSDPNKFVRTTGINFWYSDEWKFDELDSKRTWTMRISVKECPLKVGNTLTMHNDGISQGNTIGSENNANLHVNGFTTNGALSQYGLGPKATATFANVWYVNAPLRKGFEPRVEGPTMSWGHIAGFDYNTPGQPAIKYEGSKWMTTGSEGQAMQDAGDQELHDGGY